MAFFGLTALGPQNEFKEVSKFLTYLNVFEDSDYERVWRQVVGDEKHCLTAKIPAMITKLYQGPAPPNVS